MRLRKNLIGMDTIQTLHAFDQIKLLSDARRMEILRLLLAKPATLSHLARALKRSPAWIRHHLKALESAGLVELVEVRTTGTVTEKFYRAKAGAFLLQEIVLPKGKKPIVVFSGSHDLAIEEIAEQLEKRIILLNLPVGSLDGLVNLRQGFCQIAGTHLLDENGEYNTPFVRHLFPDRNMEVITLANRIQGLMVAVGNPKGIHKILDLARPTVRFVNRNPGSGTRLWFDTALKNVGIPATAISGYEYPVKTHTEAARIIANGKADVALGLQAAAYQQHLDFVPLFEERYDLVFPKDQMPTLTPLLDHLQTAVFRNELNSLTGYNAAHSGEQIPL